MRRIVALLFVLLPLPAAALEIRVHPADVVYAYEVDPARGLYTVMLQNVAVVQKDGAAVTLESLEIQAVSGGQAVQTVVIPAADLDKSAQRLAAMEAQGVLKLYDFYFQTSKYLAGVHVSGSRALAPGTALIVFGKPLLLLGLPSDGLALIAHAKDGSGKQVDARVTLKVESHKSPNAYTFPLAGTWYVGAGPNLHSHHRWATSEEFAFDLVALGRTGTPTRERAAASTTTTAMAGTSSPCPMAPSWKLRPTAPKPTAGCAGLEKARRISTSGPSRSRARYWPRATRR